MPSIAESICSCGSGTERARSPPDGKVGGFGPWRSMHDTAANAANARATSERSEFIAAQQPEIQKLCGAVVDVEPDREVLSRMVEGGAIVDGALAQGVLHDQGSSFTRVSRSVR